VLLRVEPALGHGPVAGGGDEAGELRVGDLVPVDPERRDGDRVRGALLGPLLVVAHGEGAARDPDHASVRAALAIGQPTVDGAQRPRGRVGQGCGERQENARGCDSEADHRSAFGRMAFRADGIVGELPLGVTMAHGVEPSLSRP
jgi:hypothetical protein